MDMNVAIKLSAANFYGTNASIKSHFFRVTFVLAKKNLNPLINCFRSVIHNVNGFFIYPIDRNKTLSYISVATI